MSTLNEIIYETRLDQIYNDQCIFNILLEDSILYEGVVGTIWEKIKDICKAIMDFLRRIGKWIKEKFLKIIGKTKKDVKDKADVIVKSKPEGVDSDIINEEEPDEYGEHDKVKLNKLFEVKKFNKSRISTIFMEYDAIYDENLTMEVENYANFMIMIPIDILCIVKSELISLLDVYDWKGPTMTFTINGTKRTINPDSEDLKFDKFQRICRDDINKTIIKDLLDHAKYSVIYGEYIKNTIKYLEESDDSGTFNWSEYKKALEDDLFHIEKVKISDILKDDGSVACLTYGIDKVEEYLKGNHKELEEDYKRGISKANKLAEQHKDDINKIKILLQIISALEAECTNVVNIRLDLCKKMAMVNKKIIDFLWNNIYVIKKQD